MAEYFDIASKHAIISKNKKTLRENGGFNCNAYGHQLIECKDNRNCYKWMMKIESMNDSAYIGIDDGNAHHLDDYDCFALKRSTNNYSYSYDGYIQCLGTETIGNLPSMKANDLLEITFSVADKTLSFALNDEVVHTVNDIITDNDQTYRLAVYVSMASVSIIDFENISMKDEIKKEDNNSNDNGLMDNTLLDIFLSQMDIQKDDTKLNDDEKKVEEDEEELLKELNLSEYKEWNEHDVVDWILTIEDGIFLAFESEVRTEIIKNKITGKELQNFDSGVWNNFKFTQFVKTDVILKNVKELHQQND